MRNIIHLFKSSRIAILYGILVLMCVFFSVISSDFLSSYNITSMLTNISYNGILAGTMTLLLISGSVDVSVGGVIGFLTSLMAYIYTTYPSIPVIFILLIGLVCGVLVGLGNGWLVTKFRLDPLIVTLGVMAITRGFAYVLTKGISVLMMEPVTNAIGLGGITIIPNALIIPNAVIIMAIIYVLLYIVLDKAKIGRRIYCIGVNEKAAYAAGIPIVKTKIFLFVISGGAAAVSSILLIGQSAVGMPQHGVGSEFEAITAALLGGTAFTGGKGSIQGTLAGVLILGVLFTGLTIIGVKSVQIYLFKGLLLIGVVALYKYQPQVKD